MSQETRIGLGGGAYLSILSFDVKDRQNVEWSLKLLLLPALELELFIED
jgi:hypothetical protein